MCVFLTVVTVIAMTSVIAFAEEAVSEPTQEVSVADNSVAADGETIFEVINRGEGTLIERLVHGGKVTLVGMIVVFSVLIVLMIILYIFPLIFGRKSKSADKPVEKPVAAPVSVAAVTAAPAVANKEEEIVAVATAAIAAARGESECAFNVISITQIN